MGDSEGHLCWAAISWDPFTLGKQALAPISWSPIHCGGAALACPPGQPRKGTEPCTELSISVLMCDPTDSSAFALNPLVGSCCLSSEPGRLGASASPEAPASYRRPW